MERVTSKKRKQVQHDHWTNTSTFRNSVLSSKPCEDLKGKHYVRK